MLSAGCDLHLLIIGPSPKTVSHGLLADCIRFSA